MDVGVFVIVVLRSNPSLPMFEKASKAIHFFKTNALAAVLLLKSSFWLRWSKSTWVLLLLSSSSSSNHLHRYLRYWFLLARMI